MSPAQDSTPAQPVRLDWSDVTGATAYRVQIDNASDFATPVMDRRVTSSQFTAQPLSTARHWWRVRAINATGVEGAWSSVRRFTPRTETPTATAALVTLDPTSVVGGSTARGFVSLSIFAPSGGAVVTLSVPAGAPASVPASVTVPAGTAGAPFTVTTTSVTATTSVTVSATYGGVTRQAVLTVTPPAAPPPPPPPPPPPASAALAGVTTSPTTVTGGASAQGTVSLTAAAPAEGFVVGLSEASSAVTVPASVTVAAGATTATFPITTSAVTASTPVTISAAAGGVTRTATLTVTPPASTAVLTVTATGRSGERVVSSPTGLSVVVGSTGSASFPVGTSVTLSASNGRDVVWSGACSSGGNKARTCTFTLAGAASVSASVQ